MILNREIKLGPQLRKDLVDAIVKAHEKENPKPKGNALSSPEVLRKMDDWRKAREDYRYRLIAVLASFKTLNQLIELWPGILKFVPEYIVSPAKHFPLPKKLAA